MKKVNFIIDSLEIGGAEKVLVGLANELSKTVEVSVIAIHNGPLRKDLNSNVAFYCIIDDDVERGAFTRLKRVLRRKFFIRFPDLFLSSNKWGDGVGIAFLENQAIEVVKNKRKCNEKIAWIHTNVEMQDKRFKHKVENYSPFSKIVFSSNSVRSCFNNEYSQLSKSKQRVIYNALDCELITKRTEGMVNDTIEGKYSVSVGRLCDAKNYINLIENLHSAYESGFQLPHYIIGDGPDKELIKNKIKTLRLENRVFLLGALDNPYPYIKNAHLLIHNSKWEGFGLVIVEAIMLNTWPIIRRNGATDEITDFLRAGSLFDSDQELVDLITEYQNKEHPCMTRMYEELSFSKMAKNLIEFIND